MSGKPAGEQSHAVQRFWHNYFSILEKLHVPLRARPWYRKHVEGYIQAHPDRRLADQLPHDVDAYLAAKGRLPNQQEWQFRQIVGALRVRGMATRTELTYEHWLARFCAFHDWRPLAELGATEVAAFLEHLAVQRRVASGTQRIALNALVFLLREVIGRELDVGASFTRAAAKHRISVVLTTEEVRPCSRKLRGRTRLMAALMYGTGMRLMECVRLRVWDIDFGFSQITVRDGKGGKDRVVPLPVKLVPELEAHLRAVRRL